MLSEEAANKLLSILQKRFEKHTHRHPGMQWKDVQARLEANPDKLISLNEMDITDGEPDVVGQETDTSAFIFMDCAAESPKGRRSLCYDPDALESRKEHKPKNSAIGMAAEMGIELLNEEQYAWLQKLGPFDTKTSSWVKTPEDVRKLGGAIFCDHRFGRIFTYHNGAESYYAARGFRGMILI